MLDGFVCALPFCLLWRQFTIAYNKWSNINAFVYFWFLAFCMLFVCTDHYLPFVYFQYKTPICWYVFVFCCFLVFLWTLIVLAIAFWPATHTYWRHIIHCLLLKFNGELYSEYTVDYQNEFFDKWFKKQKIFKIPNVLTLHHFPYYCMAMIFIVIHQEWSPAEWFAFSHFMQDRFYFWVLGFYFLVVFKSIFSSNLLFNQMYFYSSTTYFEGMGDVNYFIRDGNYTTRLKKEIGPPTRSGFRQVGKHFNSKKRMYRVKTYFVLDSHGQLGRFLIPISWVSFKHETYDFIRDRKSVV